MEAQRIIVSEKDLYEYFKTLSNQCLIRKTRMKIFNTMPLGIKDEFKKCMNDLKCINKKEGVYKIIPQNASKELIEYLNQFLFVLVKQ